MRFGQWTVGLLLKRGSPQQKAKGSRALSTFLFFFQPLRPRLRVENKADVYPLRRTFQRLRRAFQRLRTPYGERFNAYGERFNISAHRTGNESTQDR